MARVTLKQSRRKRRYYGVVFFVFLLAAAGVGLYRFPPSLLDINRIFRLAADKITDASADVMSAEPVLRGTVYDSSFRELAVSYLLYSIHVRPGELKNREEVVQALVEVTGLEQAVIEGRLRQRQNLVKIADDLVQEDITSLHNRGLAGVYIKPAEKRFYPEHESAAGLVGFTSEGIGLEGIEGACDMLLQPGEFKGESVPEIDFSGELVLGRDAVDVILTLDMVLQEKLEGHLQEYLEKEQASQGQAILMNAKTGAILASAGLPSFNPNYYWQAKRKSGNSHQIVVDPELYRKLLARATAIRQRGEEGTALLPETVAAHEYGVQVNETEWLTAIANRTGDSAGVPFNKTGNKGFLPQAMNVFQVAQVSASLVNGGWVVSPHVLASVYDHALEKHFTRAEYAETGGRLRVVPPATGIRLKRELFKAVKGKNDSLFYYTAKTARVNLKTPPGRYIMQKLFVGGIPARSPAMVLVIVSQRDDLYPAASDIVTGSELLAQSGKELLPILLQRVRTKGVADIPTTKDPAHYNQFLISQRMDFQERGQDKVAMVNVMPKLTGLSLRKGLQRLNRYPLMVQIKGSGRIVSQRPAPGKALDDVDECFLKLEPGI